MKNLLLIISALTIVHFSAWTQVQKATPLSALEQERIEAKADALLDEYIALKDFVGVSAGIFYQDRVIWTGGAGYRDLKNKQAATHEMRHRIASITKPMTAIAIMQLVEKGQLDLDVPIQTYFKDYPRSDKGELTLRHLLQHVGGVPYYKNRKEGFPSMHFNSLEEAVALFKDRPLLHQPGTAYLYTTYGYTLLGAILEKVTGQSYADYMSENIWTPAGMKNTHLEIFGQSYPNQAQLYKKTKKGTFTADKQTDLSLKYPGGGLLSTVDDLLHFGQAVLDHQLITEESLEQMRIPAEVEWKGTPYGMGWYVVDDPVYGRIVRHGGSQSGTSTYLSIFLDQRFVVAVLANNIDGNVYNLHRELYEMTLDSNKRMQPLRKIIDLPEEALTPYVGQYELRKGQVLTITRKGNQLMTQVGEYPPIPIYAIAKNKFFYRLFDAQLEFELNDQNQVVKSTYIQKGEAIVAKKRP